MKSFYVLIFILTSIIGTITSAQNNDTQLNYIVNRAINFSPLIKALKIKKEISKEEIKIGTSLPDPVLNVGLANLPVNSFTLTQEPMTGKIIGLSQSFPFPGKLSELATAKATDTLIVEEELREKVNIIRKEIATLYFEILLLDAKINITEKQKDLLYKVKDVTEEKYRVGKASLQNLVQTEVEITKLEDALINLKNKREGLYRKLSIGIYEQPEITDFNRFNYDENIFKKIELNKAEKLLHENPKLKILLLAKRKAEKLKEVKKYGLYPNFKVSVQYNQRDYNKVNNKDWADFLSMIIGITLPFDYGGSKRADIKKAYETEKFYYEQYNALNEKLRAELALKVTRLNEFTERKLLISEKLLPQAKKALSSANADYNTGKIDFINVLKSEKQLLKTESKYYDVLFGYFRLLEEIQYLLGTNQLSEIFITE